MVPETLAYTKDHEWLRLEGDEGVVGITDHAQKELGDIVFLELPEPGRALSAGEEMGTVESVKAVSEIYSPVSGKVIDVNRALTEDPDSSATVNRDPYGEGWMVRILLSDPTEIEGLLDPAAYRRYLEEGAD
jgi:glycine cleavage system H protein